MHKDDKILFSDRFQTMYEYLGMFSYLYIGSGSKGIKRDSLITASGKFKKDTPSVIKLLESGNILFEENGLLHLNRWQFYTMTMWDLMVLAEPWLNMNDPPSEPGGQQTLRSFCRSQKLSAQYKL